MTPDEAIDIISKRGAGRTRYEGQEPDPAEVLAVEVGRLREVVRVNALRHLYTDAEINAVIYPWRKK